MSRTYRPNGERERSRRVRQGAALHQVSSHLPSVKTRLPVIWPRHLGQIGDWTQEVIQGVIDARAHATHQG